MKKQFKKVVSFALALAMIVGVSTPISGDAKKAGKPKLSNKKITVKVGQKKKLTMKNTKKKVKWSVKSGKKNITLTGKKKTSVSIKGKKVGKAVVLAKIGKKKYTCTVTVKKATPDVTKAPDVTKTPVATNTPEPVVTEAPTETPAQEAVPDVTIDLTKCSQTVFTSSPAKLGFADQLDSRFDLKYYSKVTVTWEAKYTDDDTSTHSAGKIGLPTNEDDFSGYADGVALSYDFTGANTSLTISLSGDGIEGKPLGINIQPANASWSWPETLEEVKITSIVFTAKKNAVYDDPNAPVVATPTPGPTYAPEEFQYEGLDISWIDPEKPMVAFTFDDGPIGTAEDGDSMIIQNALKKYGAHATFFYIGQSINSEEKIEEIRMAHEAGFEIGNHSYGWTSMKSQKEEAVKESIEKTNALLQEITGYENFLFRAPELAISQTMKNYIKAPFINATIDSKDWTGADAATIMNNVKAAGDGDIVLMHEFNSHAAECIDELLDYYINDMGYQVVSVSELFAVKGKKLMTGSVYSSAK